MHLNNESLTFSNVIRVGQENDDIFRGTEHCGSNYIEEQTLKLYSMCVMNEKEYL